MMLSRCLVKAFASIVFPAENRYFSKPLVMSTNEMPSSMSSSETSKAELSHSLMRVESVFALFDCPAIFCTLLPSPNTEMDTSDENNAGRITANKTYETRKAYNLY